MEKIRDNKLSYFTIVLSLLFAVYIGSIFIGSTLLFAIHIPITRLNFIIFPIIAMIIAKITLKKDDQRLSWKTLIFSLILFFLICSLLALINNSIWDYSYDSRAYHQEAVIALTNGWNPFYQSNIPMNIWFMHYAKASCVFAATIFKLTNRIESAKILTTLLPLVLLVLSIGVFNLITKGKKTLSICAAIILVLCPVTIGQMFSYYVDSLVGIYVIMLIMVVFLILFFKDLHYFKYLALINIAIFLSNIKFTGLAYAGVILLAFLICSFIFNKKSYNIKLLIFLILSLIITVGVIGFNPYITNTIHNGNPLYPLAGKGKINIMTANTPSDFRYDNSFEQFYKSMVATPSLYNPSGSSAQNLKQLLSVNKGVLELYSGTDARLRGFGVYSIIFLPIAVLGMLYLLITCKNKKYLIFSLLTIIFLTATFLAAGSFWWARYIPFVWLMPVGVGLLMMLKKSKISKVIGFLLLILILVNSLIIIPTAIHTKIDDSNKLKTYIFTKPLIIKENNFMPSYINKAKEFDLKYTLEK
ncbi:MAG: hypothetical protein ACRC41_09460 [Sarcina sp.]